ncbi:MAG: hypothetical protein ABSF87_14040 [Xanthobacteraceae bacterium]|jgi:1,2-phenylacetyl-CoA epoxidase catalytic subunit
MSFLPFLPQEYSAAALRGAYHEFAAEVIGMSAGLQTSGDRQRRCEGLNAGFSPAAQMLYEAAAEALHKLKKFKIATAADEAFALRWRLLLCWQARGPRQAPH